MGKNIAVEDCVLECTPRADATITTPPSSHVKASGKGCYRGSITIMVTNAAAVSDNNGTGTGNLSGSARHTKIDGVSAVLEGDSVTITVNGTSGGSPATGQVTVKIKDAGQKYVLSQ